MNGAAPKKPIAKRAVKWVGVGLTLACLGFVGWKLARKWEELAPLMTPELLMIAVSGVVLYLAANFLLSFAWFRLLIFCGGAPPSQALCHVVYGTTQIGKYLPGNVFHFVGRQVVGRAAKMSDSALALASLLEIALFPTAAACVALVAGGTAPFLAMGVSPSWLWVGAAAVGGGVLVLPYVVPKITARLGLSSSEVPFTLARIPSLLVPLSSYALFLLISAGICGALAWGAGQGDIPLALLFASYPVAWILGFVVPGASGGIGVREAVLLALLGPTMGEARVLLMATTLRGVTILGELGFFLVARAMGATIPGARI